MDFLSLVVQRSLLPIFPKMELIGKGTYIMLSVKMLSYFYEMSCIVISEIPSDFMSAGQTGLFLWILKKLK